MQWSVEEISTPLRFAPGSSWGYGVSTDWAAIVLEAITGRTLNDYTGEYIFRPLGMADSGFNPKLLPQTANRTVQAAMRNIKTGELASAANFQLPTEHEVDSGGGGLYTTPYDYATFLRGLLAGRLLREETFAEMLKPQLDAGLAKYLKAVAFHPTVRNTFVPEFPGAPIPLNHSLGGLLNLVDVPGKRRAGSMAWSGMHNCRWVSIIEDEMPASLFRLRVKAIQQLTNLNLVDRYQDGNRRRVDCQHSTSRRPSCSQVVQ